MTLRIAWFATARGTSSRGLLNSALNAIAEHRLDAEIVCVVCNRERGQSANTDAFLDDVERAGIPLIARSSGAWRKSVDGEVSDPSRELASWRRDFDAFLYERMADYQPDIAVLAGYMLIVTDVICDNLACLNLHPALPDGPIGTWQQVVHQLIAERARRSGLVMQRVTTDLDRGPAVTWAQYPIQGPEFAPLWEQHGADAGHETPLFHAIREAGARREPTFVIRSLQAIAEGQARIPASDSTTAGWEISDLVEADMRSRH
ncbi:MAG: formyltransferase family protein [Chloroflexi bacterium]|nr:formyltransferase family protein [Chloroflexota bacterium]